MKKKLIEVSMPIEPINKACAHEKSVRHGHPSTLHLYWARRPLAAATSTFFGTVITDPGSRSEFVELGLAREERDRLHSLIVDLIQWSKWTNESVIALARDELLREFDGSLPTCLDPFAGGGSIPLAQARLGCRVVAEDLNPVAQMINIAQLDVVHRFANQLPISQRSRGENV